MKKIAFCILIGLLVNAVYGCAPRINWSDTTDIASHITRTRDEYKKNIKYDGPDYTVSEGPFGSDMTTTHLRAFKFDNNLGVTYQIYVERHYEGNWIFYKDAYDIDGLELDVIAINRQVISCPSNCVLKEDILIKVSPWYLQSHEDTGIKFKIIGKRGGKEIFVPGAYIKVFLSVVTE